MHMSQDATGYFPTQTMKGCLVKYKKGEWRTVLVRLTYPHQQDRRSLLNFCAPELIFGEIKEDAAVVAISLLTLFIICLQALICCTDVVGAPPSSADMTECLVTAVRQRACVRNDSIHTVHQVLFIQTMVCTQ